MTNNNEEDVLDRFFSFTEGMVCPASMTTEIEFDPALLAQEEGIVLDSDSHQAVEDKEEEEDSWSTVDESTQALGEPKSTEQGQAAIKAPNSKEGSTMAVAQPEPANQAQPQEEQDALDTIFNTVEGTCCGLENVEVGQDDQVVVVPSSMPEEQPVKKAPSGDTDNTSQTPQDDPEAVPRQVQKKEKSSWSLFCCKNEAVVDSVVTN